MTALRASARWPVWLIALALYPLASGAVAVNLFFLALLGLPFGGAAITPVAALAFGAVLGVPAALWFGGRLRRLMDAAQTQTASEPAGPPE